MPIPDTHESLHHTRLIVSQEEISKRITVACHCISRPAITRTIGIPGLIVTADQSPRFVPELD